MRLSDTAIRKAKPGEKAYKLFDGRGLFLLIKPAGSRLWRFKYRWLGREKQLSLGAYPDVSLSSARSQLDKKRALLASGVDPSVERKNSKATDAHNATNTLESVAREWHQQNLSKWVPEHATRTMRRLELHIFPWLGTKPLAELQAADLLPHLRRIEQGGSIETAHRVLTICSQVCRYGIATARLTNDPTKALLPALATPPVRHLPAVTDPARLSELLRMIDGYGGTLPVRCALRFAPLVFVRPGELRKARWADIDFEKAQWAFVSTKKGIPLIVPLARQALSILRELQPLTGRSEYVFPSFRSKARPMSNVAVNAALRRIGIPANEMCAHGFRATARTILEEVLNVSPNIIEHQLTHVIRGPLGRAYTRTEFLPERRLMMQKWADYLDSLKSGEPIEAARGDHGG